MSCYGCNQEIDFKKAQDEKIRSLAKSRAKETGKTIGLARNERGELAFCEEGQTPTEFYSPHA